MANLTPDEQKELFKKALQEWLDAKYSEFGRWTLHGVAAASLVALVVFMTGHGVKLESFIGK